MDRVEFGIVPPWEPPIMWPTVEPLINGDSLLGIFGRLDGQGEYAGLWPYRLLGALSRPGDKRVQVLGCNCGDEGCSWVTVQIDRLPEAVVWHGFRASHSTTRTLAAVGPFRFGRREYDNAVAAPVLAEALIGDGPARWELARAIPRDHHDWLQGIRQEVGWDPGDHEAEAIAWAGLYAFARAGRPMSETTVRRWVRHPDGATAARILKLVRAANDSARPV